jgi:hypothetical protein
METFIVYYNKFISVVTGRFMHKHLDEAIYGLTDEFQN